MRKNVSFYYGYNSPYRKRIELIKECGFSGVMAMYKFSPTFFQECDAILTEGLNIESLHLPYSGIANLLWGTPNEVKKYIGLIEEGIEYAKETNAKSVVVHVSSGFNPPHVTAYGVSALKEVALKANGYGVEVCLENLKTVEHLFAFYNASDTPFKLCFDSGHAEAYWDKGISGFPFEKFKDLIINTHIHDNDGVTDGHLLPFNGVINFSLLAKKLSSCPFLEELTLELTGGSQHVWREDEFLLDAFKRLEELEAMIMRYKNEQD